MATTSDDLRARFRAQAAEVPAQPAQKAQEAPKRQFRSTGPSAPRKGSIDPMTPPQERYLKKLLSVREGIEVAEDVRSRLNEWKAQGGITKAGASWAIEALLAIPEPTPQSTPEQLPNGQTALAVPDPANPWPGIYTVVGADGEHRAFEVRFQGPEESFAPGQTILSWLAGPDREPVQLGFLKAGRFLVWRSRKDRVNARLSAAVTQLLDDPSSALEAKHCLRCNDLLTTPESIERGIGPVCAKAWGWA